MYRVRFHGRGGQGIKTAARILGTAFFLAGYEVQDAPGDGDECHGAPMLAYVRASRVPINEHGIMHQAELVIVADDHLIAIPTAGVLKGIGEDTVLLIYSDNDTATWQSRLNLNCKLIVLPTSPDVSTSTQYHYAASQCAGAAAQLLGVIPAEQLQHAIEQELAGHHRRAIVDKHIRCGIEAFDSIHPHKACVRQVRQISAADYPAPHWISLSFELTQQVAAELPVRAAHEQDHRDSSQSIRPLIDYSRCHRCWWLCSNFCPSKAIHAASEQYPRIDYDHCQGCMVCVGQCPPHAISGMPKFEIVNQIKNGIPA